MIKLISQGKATDYIFFYPFLHIENIEGLLLNSHNLFFYDNAHFIKPYRSPVYLKPDFGKVLWNGL